MYIMSNFGEKLRELMEERNLSATDIQRNTGISNSRIYDWQKYAIMPYLSSLIKLSDYFGVSIEYLTGRTDENNYDTLSPRSTFPERLKLLAQEKNLSYYRIAKDNGFERNLITKWVRGASPILINLIILADYFNCTLDYLAGRL